MDLVFFGIQGSGKGTQAKKLALECGYDIFEAGGELRKIAASGSELGTLVKSFIDVGKLAPHDIVMRVVREAVLARPKAQKILFDGIPRDSDQMRDFDKIMHESGRDFRCIHITLPKERALQRILDRAKLECRADDTDEEIIVRRMNTFLTKTVPVIDTYRSGGKVVDIEGDRTVEQVYDELKRLVLC